MSENTENKSEETLEETSTNFVQTVDENGEFPDPAEYEIFTTSEEEFTEVEEFEAPQRYKYFNEWGEEIDIEEAERLEKLEFDEAADYEEQAAKYKRSKVMPKVLDFVKSFSSPSAAFIILALGIIVQSVHTYFIGVHLSSLAGWVAYSQAALLAFFLTGALAYFSIRASNGSKSAYQLAWIFFGLETFMNLYYYADKYIIEPWGTPDVLWAKLIIAIPLSVAIPWTIKAYSSEIGLFMRPFKEPKKRLYKQPITVVKRPVLRPQGTVYDELEPATILDQEYIKSEVQTAIDEALNTTQIAPELTAKADDAYQTAKKNEKNMKAMLDAAQAMAKGNEVMKTDLQTISKNVDDKLLHLENDKGNYIRKGDDIKLKLVTKDTTTGETTTNTIEAQVDR